MLDSVQGVGGRLIVRGYRRLAAELGCAPTAKTTDKKILEVYAHVGTAFHEGEQRRGEHIPAPYLNTIVWQFLQLYETLGPECERAFQNHLQYEVERFVAEGLREDYQQALRLFDENSGDPDVVRAKQLQAAAKGALTQEREPPFVSSEIQSDTTSTRINEDVLREAGYLIARDCGDLSHLPDEMQDTVVNIYYAFCLVTMQAKQEFFCPPGGLAGLKTFFSDADFYRWAIKSIPPIVNNFRKVSPGAEEYSFFVTVFSDMFKYRIPDVLNKTPEQLRLERPAYAAKIQEIPDLWIFLKAITC